MKSKVIASVAALLWAFAPVGFAEPEKKAETKSDVLEMFAKLAGEWVGKGKHGDAEHDAKVSYKVTSGGSAVVETIDPGGDHEMVTIIHPDGDSLLLTHYCMLGNQPQMRAKPKAGDKKVAFEFVKATNMKSENDMHMRTVTYTFVDKDTLVAEWTTYVDGKDGGKAVFEMKRKK
jgi:hypothetical protein